jgi:hypothetical protein
MAVALAAQFRSTVDQNVAVGMGGLILDEPPVLHGGCWERQPPSLPDGVRARHGVVFRIWPEPWWMGDNADYDSAVTGLRERVRRAEKLGLDGLLIFNAVRGRPQGLPVPFGQKPDHGFQLDALHTVAAEYLANDPDGHRRVWLYTGGANFGQWEMDGRTEHCGEIMDPMNPRHVADLFQDLTWFKYEGLVDVVIMDRMGVTSVGDDPHMCEGEAEKSPREMALGIADWLGAMGLQMGCEPAVWTPNEGLVPGYEHIVQFVSQRGYRQQNLAEFPLDDFEVVVHLRFREGGGPEWELPDAKEVAAMFDHGATIVVLSDLPGHEEISQIVCELAPR